MSLKLLFVSSALFTGVGYGVAMNNLMQRVKADGHEVVVATKHPLGGQLEVNGILHIDGTQVGILNAVKKEDKFDYIVSMMDDWVLPNGWEWDDWVSISMLDTGIIHPRLLDRASKTIKVVAPTRFTESEFRRNGFDPFYAPIGIDTVLFKPDPERRKIFRTAKGWADDKFVIGCLGINYSSDRKNFINVIKAFAKFHKNHADSILYMHTDMLGESTQGLNLQWIVKDLGFPEDGSGAVQCVPQLAYRRWNLSQEVVSRTYNGIDVFCWPSQGEGMGMPLMEAEACGTPAIVSATTSGRELCKGGWLIEEGEDDVEFSSHQTWIMRARPSEILAKMEEAYQSWKEGTDFKRRQQEAREGMLGYDWDLVYKEYWKPVLKWMEERKAGTIVTIKHYPDYKNLYNGFGAIFYPEMLDCEKLDHDLICQRLKFIKLQNEPEEDPRPIMMRSYPIFPDAEGNLLVHTKCMVHNYLPPRFITECKNIYKELFSYPKVAQEIKKKWLDKSFEEIYGTDYIRLDSIIPEFNDEYSSIFQKILQTVFYIDDTTNEFLKDCKTILDVGCGDGKIIDLLNKKEGVVAKGTEVNSKWVDGDKIIYGDIHDLPFKGDSFDALLCVDVLEHVKDPHKALSEIFRVVSKKLVLVVTPIENKCYYEDPTHIVDWSFERWKREINEYGEIKRVDFAHGILFVEKRK